MVGGGASLTMSGVPLRSLALPAPRGRVFGTGPNDFPHRRRAMGQNHRRDDRPDCRLTVVCERTTLSAASNSQPSEA